ncbi:mortality factor 4/mrg-like protein [Vairimorpha necatrix]|uniref:Mortality factor 4/mrg-like protein n=1 Tax=Vairimorpha necatrix TaxID=6039 RepID=A0AAX4JF50_9MICR
MVLPKIEVNQYVVFKNNEEWQEGRILDYTNTKQKLIYKILSFKYYTEVELHDHVLVSSSENIKKISKYNLESEILNNTVIKDIIQYDSVQKSKGLRYSSKEYPLSKIIVKFSRHLVDNKIHLSGDEINMSIEGIYDIIREMEYNVSNKNISNKDNVFNKDNVSNKDIVYSKDNVPYKNLDIYNKDVDSNLVNNINKSTFRQNIDPNIDEEGFILGLKVCYLTMKYFLKHETSLDVKNTVYSFCLYFLDYLIINSEIYYTKTEYI